MEDSQFLEGGWKFPTVRSGAVHQLPDLHCGEHDINQSIDDVLQTYLTERCIPYLNCEPCYVLDNVRVRRIALKDEIAFFVRCVLLNAESRIYVNEVQVMCFTQGGNMVDISIWYTIKQTDSLHYHIVSLPLSE